jgi:two-component system, chemotaxis family, chemotaxis protein CheY
MTRVMIVDDAEFMRMIIRDTLIKHGHEVVAEVADGEEAIQTYLKIKPDLVLMDITMPNMSGDKALKKLIGIDPKAKVVMCSSLGQQAMITESMNI